ncbi:NAD-dependent epimerase/dehydratase family protein [Mesorhizobium sp. NZP2298]|nr:NAD-dependent epimerase/dehydratase family protein [Mesorhizobium sp. NZP2298]
MVLHYGDTTDAANLISLRQETQPVEIYNLAAQSHVQPPSEREYTANADTLGTLLLLSDPHSSSRERNAVLPGVNFRTLWFGPGHARPMRWRSSTPTGSP